MGVKGWGAIGLMMYFFSLPTMALEEPDFWIDVRTPEEYSAGHVEGAINIPYKTISGIIINITQDKNSLIYVYCQSGNRSGRALNSLNQIGYDNVVNVGGLTQAKELEKQLHAR